MHLYIYLYRFGKLGLRVTRVILLFVPYLPYAAVAGIIPCNSSTAEDLQGQEKDDYVEEKQVGKVVV